MPGESDLFPGIEDRMATVFRWSDGECVVADVNVQCRKQRVVGWVDSW